MARVNEMDLFTARKGLHTAFDLWRQRRRREAATSMPDTKCNLRFKRSPYHQPPNFRLNLLRCVHMHRYYVSLRPRMFIYAKFIWAITEETTGHRMRSNKLDNERIRLVAGPLSRFKDNTDAT